MDWYGMLLDDEKSSKRSQYFPSTRSPPLQPEWCQSIDRAAVLIWSQGAAKEREISGYEESLNHLVSTFFASSQNSQKIGSTKENFNYKSPTIFDHSLGPELPLRHSSRAA